MSLPFLDRIRGNRWATYTIGLSVIAVFIGSILFMTGYFSFMFQEEQYVSMISGYVYEDRNGNGIFDPGEPILSNVDLNLFDESGLIASNTSGVDGSFQFTVSQAGTYVVEEGDPDSWHSTTPNEVEVVVESGYSQRFFVDFGDKPYNASIIGIVFDDSDFDGVRDPGEDGIPGVEVGIYLDDNLLNQTDTDVGGVFSFTLYQPGIYEVVETDPDGRESTTDNSATVVIESISGDVFEVSFGDTDAERSEIVCVLFNDTNADGVKGFDESGIPGVSVELYDSEGFVSSQETGADGVCTFSMEQIGEYLVGEASPEGWYNTTSRDARVVVGSLYGEVVDVEFGETLGASILGKVYDDDNADGAWEVDEDGLEGVNVSLYRNSILVDVFNTGDSGNFSFFMLEPGSYHLNETDLPGWHSITPGIVNVTIEHLAGQEYYILFGDKEAGHVEPPDEEEPEPATIHGVVYHDSNGNEAQEFFEDGISGVTIRLYEGESLVAVDTTDSDGSYEFSGLDPGVYEVVETDLSGWYSVSSNRVEVEVDEGESVKVDFADNFVPPPPPPPQYGSISGLVFDDVDGDGELDPEEPGLEDVTVSIYRGDNFVSSDTTDSNGAFSFSSVTTGSYRVVESDPAGWHSTTPNSVALTVSANKVTSVVFGDAEYSIVWGYAFNDTDGDGDRGEEEFGISGVNVSATFGSEIHNSTTDEGGYYLFDDLSYVGPFNITADLPDGHFRTTPGLVFWDVYYGEDSNVDFGYASLDSTFGVVYGTVFEDMDHNETQEIEESGIPEVTVQLYYEGGLIDEVVTNYFGQYTLRTSFGGEHDLAEFDLPGYVSTTPNNLSVSLTIGSSGPSPVDFGDFYGTKITGMVFNDTNVNGVWDEELGLPGALVSCGGDSFNTSSDGTYSLYVSGIGSFNLTETDPDGYVSTNAIPGSSNVSKIDANSLSVQIDSPGSILVGNLFGDVNGSEVWEVGGMVFNDLNANGLWDDEPGLAGAVVDIGIPPGGSQNNNWTTGADGLWLLYFLPGTTVNVTEINPDGYVSTNAIPGPGSVKLTHDKVMVNANGSYIMFGDATYSGVAIVSGHVFYDEDENGVYNASDSDFGMSDVNVTLEVPVDNETTNEIWTQTDLNGSYQFAVLAGTEVRITSTRPEGHYPTTIESVVVRPSSPGVYPDNNFGYSNDTNVAVVTGLVFYDRDSDGEVIFGEGGLAGANVSLRYDGVGIANVTTSDNGLIGGTFMFRVNETGHYGVNEVNPIGYRSTTPDQVNVNVVALGQEYFVEFGDTNSTEWGSIYGTVFNDIDGDGKWDVEEPTIPGVNITFDGTLTIKTKDYGQFTYGFETNAIGIHTVVETDLPDWVSTTPNEIQVDVENGMSYVVNFGDAQPTTISGHIFVDNNTNGIYDIGESGGPGFPVQLLINDTYYYVAGTNESGFYEFNDIPPNNYRVVGFNASQIPYIQNSTSTDVSISAEAGASYTVDMGYYLGFPNMSAILCQVNLNITGFGEGALPISIPGLSLTGVEVTLENSTLTQTKVTDWMGMCFFPVSPGDYNLTETDPDIPGLFSVTPNRVNVTVGVMDIAWVEFTDSFELSGLMASVYNDTNVNGTLDGSDYFIPDGDIRVYNGSKLVASSDDAIDIFSFSFPLPNLGDSGALSDLTTFFNTFGFNPFGGGGGPIIDQILGVFQSAIDLSSLFTLPDIMSNMRMGFNVSWFGSGVIKSPGGYFFILPPGNYTVVEIDPDGYISTTPNSVEIEAVLFDLSNFPDITSFPWALFGDAKEAAKLTIDKEVLGSDGFWHDAAQVLIGEPVQYRFILNNTGTTNVTDINVYDSILGPISIPATTLKLGEGMIATVISTAAVSGYHDNVVEANGTYEDLVVYASDVASYLGVTDPVAKIDVQKYVSDKSNGPWFEHVFIETGYPVYFKVVVKNTGDVTLDPVSLHDSQEGEIYEHAIIPPGVESLEVYDSYDTYATGTYINWAYATGTWRDDQTVWTTARDNASYTAFTSLTMISVAKNVSTSITGPWMSHVDVDVGDTVYYRLNITNVGEKSIDLEEAEDSLEGYLPLYGITLDPGESHLYYYDTEASDEGNYTNTVSILGVHYGPMTYGDWDNSSASYTAVFPEVSISVVKKVAPTSHGPWLEHVNKIEGGTIYYNVTVTNTGDVPLDDVYVTDTVEGTLWSDAYLAAGESMSTTYSAAVVLGEHNNTVEAEGTWSFWPLFTQDEDNASYTGIDSSIASMKVEKKASNSSTGPWLEHVNVTAGEDLVWYNVTVTNNGAETLSDITVWDDYPADHQISMPNTTLTPGESMSTTYNYSAEYNYHENTVDVDGAWYNDTTIYVDNSSLAAYTGVLPYVEISVEKKVSNVSDTGPWVEHVEAIAGEDTVYFNVTVTNTGAVTLDDILVEDSFGPLTLPVSTLLPGDSSWVNYSRPAKAGYVINIASANGTWHSTNYGYAVDAFDYDTANYTGALPEVSLSIEKMVSNVSDTGPWYEHAEVTAGEDTVYFNVTVINTCDVNISDIEILDWNGTIWVPKTVPKSWLAPDESMTVFYNVTALVGFNENEAGVGGTWHSTYHGYAQPLWETDNASYTGLYPGIKVDKLVYGLDGLWHDDAKVLVDENVWYKFKVKNSGSLNLTGISVVDDVLGAITMPKTALAVGESMTSANVSGLELAQLGYHDNTVNASASWKEIEVFYLDTASYTGFEYATISGTVYNDANATEVQEPGEAGLNNVTVTLYNGTKLLATVVTATDGNYSFPILETGSYRVVETDPSGWYSTTPEEVNVTIGALLKQDVEVDFGDIQESERLIWDQWTCSAGSNYMSPVLTDARQYRIEVSNQFIYNTTLDGRADAMYYSPDGWTNYYPAPSGHSFMQIDGGDIAWGAYNSAHIYSISFEGAGASLRFQSVDWIDSTWGNNGGGLVIRIYRVFS